MRWLLLLLFVGIVFAENPEENGRTDDPDLFEGDMILTPEQKWAALNGMDVDATERGSTKGRLWPGGVMPYVIDSSLSRYSEAMSAIRAGMDEWARKTCITFKQRTNERVYANFKLGSGCSSLVGWIGDRQDIHLAQGCWTRGIVAHEIGHALGFWHEQSRPDRDSYVTIVWENISGYSKHNFNKYNRGTIDSLGIKYDYGSVMHYGSTAFSKNGKPTIVPKQSGVQIGQRRGISATDAQQMNLLYKGQCSDGGGGGGGSTCEDKESKCPSWTRYCKSHKWVRAACKKTCSLC